MEREFLNELGNHIKITVTREVPDTDLVCSVCRWRAGHDPKCAHAGEPWPTFLLSNDRALVRIEGPSSASENYLTPIEVRELALALSAEPDDQSGSEATDAAQVSLVGPGNPPSLEPN